MSRLSILMLTRLASGTMERHKFYDKNLSVPASWCQTSWSKVTVTLNTIMERLGSTWKPRKLIMTCLYSK